jgi:hypothetical protein
MRTVPFVRATERWRYFRGLDETRAPELLRQAPRPSATSRSPSHRERMHQPNPPWTRFEHANPILRVEDMSRSALS